MALSRTTVAKIYAGVIDDVIGGVRDSFIEEGVDEQVLMELKQTWETRLQATKAVEATPEPEAHPPVLKQTLKNTMPLHIQGTGQNSTGVVPLDYPNKNVALQITLPAQQGVPDSQPRSLTIQVPASALQGNQLQSVLSGPVISATMALPPPLAASLLQQHVTTTLQGQPGVIQIPATNTVHNTDNVNRTTFSNQNNGVTQLDGQNDTSDDDDDDEEDEEEDIDDDDDDADEKEDEENEDIGGAEEPLNSGDDVSEEDLAEMFETDNVVVCQYDKVTRSRNKWKFYLKDGIMNLGGKDYVFQKSSGDAEW